MREQLSGREAVGIYLYLKKHESELDNTLTQLMSRIEKALYAELSIDEFERLDELYRSNADPWKGE